MRAALLAAAIVSWCLPLSASAGGIYRYVERDGTIVYTNVPPKGAAALKARKLPGTFRPSPSKWSGSHKLTASMRELSSRYEEWIEAAAARYRIPANLVRAVMHVESAFDPTAVSDKGASGLMQLMPQTARELYVRDIFDPKENIEGGTRYLRVLANEFDGDMVQMVAAYNAGPNAVRKFGGKVPPFEETQAYVRRVVALYFQYKGELNGSQAQSPQG